MRIKINKGEVKRVGQRLCGSADDLRSQKKEFDTIINSLSDVWIGTDYTVCRDIIDEKLLPSLEKAAVAIEGLGNYLKRVPATYDAVDNVFKSKKY